LLFFSDFPLTVILLKIGLGRQSGVRLGRHFRARSQLFLDSAYFTRVGYFIVTELTVKDL
jgi:hypothetical protein